MGSIQGTWGEGGVDWGRSWETILKFLFCLVLKYFLSLHKYAENTTDSRGGWPGMLRVDVALADLAEESREERESDTEEKTEEPFPKG